jgi:hypothetical protein
MPNKILLGFVGILALYVILSSIIYPISNPNIACEDINFANNNTFYSTAENPIVTVKGIYDDDACTDAFPASRYIWSTTQVKLYTNGTTAYPNITTGHHYVNYDYQKDLTIVGINFGFVIIIALLVVVFRWISKKK